MARVAVLLKVFPEDISVNFEDLVNRIKESLPPGYTLELWDTEPIAFGLSALRVLVTMPENVEGGTEQLEEIISSIPGVSQVEVVLVQRLF